MIKQELRSLIFNVLPKEDAFHPRLIDACLEKALTEMLWELFAVDPHALQRYTVRYGVPTAITVSYNDTTGLYYSTLPCAIIPMPDKASGVRRISTVTQGNMKFFPMDQRELDLMYNSNYAEIINNKIGYVVKQTEVEYYAMTAAIAATGVRLDILQPFSVYADTDTVLIPEFRDNQGATLVERVLKMLQTVQPYDTIDDNAVEQTKVKQ